MATKTKFIEGEKVLCFHGPLIYEAKCLKVQSKEKEKPVKYLVHYAGWNKNWDEWVLESRVLKLNDANLQRQKDLQDAHAASLKQKKAAKKFLEKKREGGSGGGRNGGAGSGGEDSRSSTPSTDGSSKRASSAAPADAAQSSDADNKDDATEAKKKKLKIDSTVETVSEAQFLC
ncbi:RNA binding activity-knot of a chromodomain [Trinorchestia longiramus]|nr:RNA binding activity-knot of a chromodomain [Trinorchestia longiramus]